MYNCPRFRAPKHLKAVMGFRHSVTLTQLRIQAVCRTQVLSRKDGLGSPSDHSVINPDMRNLPTQNGAACRLPLMNLPFCVHIFQPVFSVVSCQLVLEATPPPPCRSPPLVVPRGGAGGPSPGQPKIFRYGSLCCCVGDCVVGYCHLYPLYSWQDILLTFAEWNLTAQPCFSLGQM